MQRIQEVGGVFVGGDPSTNTKGTIVTADWLNAVQEELAGLVEALGGTLDPEDNGQVYALLVDGFVSAVAGRYIWPGGLTLMWGTGVSGSDVAAAITFPYAFTGVVWGVYCQARRDNASVSLGDAPTLTGFLVSGLDHTTNNVNSAVPFYYLAWGKNNVV